MGIDELLDELGKPFGDKSDEARKYFRKLASCLSECSPEGQLDHLAFAQVFSEGYGPDKLYALEQISKLYKKGQRDQKVISREVDLLVQKRRKADKIEESRKYLAEFLGEI